MFFRVTALSSSARVQESPLVRIIATQTWHLGAAKAPAKLACGLLGRQLALHDVAIFAAL